MVEPAEAEAAVPASIEPLLTNAGEITGAGEAEKLTPMLRGVIEEAQSGQHPVYVYGHFTHEEAGKPDEKGGHYYYFSNQHAPSAASSPESCLNPQHDAFSKKLMASRVGSFEDLGLQEVVGVRPARGEHEVSVYYQHKHRGMKAVGGREGGIFKTGVTLDADTGTKVFDELKAHPECAESFFVGLALCSQNADSVESFLTDTEDGRKPPFDNWADAGLLFFKEEKQNRPEASYARVQEGDWDKNAPLPAGFNALYQNWR